MAEIHNQFFNAQTDNGDSSVILLRGKQQVHITGTFDGCTVKMQTASAGVNDSASATFADVPDSSKTAADTFIVNLADVWAKFNVASAGASTSVDVWTSKVRETEE